MADRQEALFLPEALVQQLSTSGRAEVEMALEQCLTPGGVQQNQPEGDKERVQMDDPCISIDRQAKRYAIFDGLTCIGEFKSYTDEAVAEADARREIAKLTDKEPQIVYPRITRMTMSSSSGSRRRS